MNRGLLMVMIPAILVAMGYLVVMRLVGVRPGYLRLAVAMAVFFGGIFWLERRYRNKAGAAGK
jgi:uncharacterized membrane protein